MDVAKLKLMINQIDQNIPFPGEKSEVIATHLKKFWTPVMRADIYKEVQANPGDYSDAVKAAVSSLHQEAKA